MRAAAGGGTSSENVPDVPMPGLIRDCELHDCTFHYEIGKIEIGSINYGVQAGGYPAGHAALGNPMMQPSGYQFMWPWERPYSNIWRKFDSDGPYGRYNRNNTPRNPHRQPRMPSARRRPKVVKPRFGHGRPLNDDLMYRIIQDNKIRRYFRRLKLTGYFDKDVKRTTAYAMKILKKDHKGPFKDEMRHGNPPLFRYVVSEMIRKELRDNRKFTTRDQAIAEHGYYSNLLTIRNFRSRRS